MYRPRKLLATTANRFQVRCYNINKALDKEHELKSFKEIIALPPSAISGLTPEGDAVFKKLRITTIKQLGNWKAYKFAKAVVHLNKFEDGNGTMPDEAASNLSKILDKEYINEPLKKLLKAPLSSVKGVAPWADSELAEFKNMKTLKDLANFKYCQIAEGLVAFAEFEKSAGK